MLYSVSLAGYEYKAESLSKKAAAIGVDDPTSDRSYKHCTRKFTGSWFTVRIKNRFYTYNIAIIKKFYSFMKVSMARQKTVWWSLWIASLGTSRCFVL